jgi:hypothetical protein
MEGEPKNLILKQIELGAKILRNTDSIQITNEEKYLTKLHKKPYLPPNLFKYNLTTFIIFSANFIKNLIIYNINEHIINDNRYEFKKLNTFNDKNTLNLISYVYEHAHGYKEKEILNEQEFNNIETLLINLYYNYCKNKICNAIYINKFIKNLLELNYILNLDYLNENEYVDFSQFDISFLLNDEYLDNSFFYIKELNDVSNFHLVISDNSIKDIIDNYCQYAKIKIDNDEGSFIYDVYNNWGFNFLNKVFNEKKIIDEVDRQENIKQFKNQINIFFELFKINKYNYIKPVHKNVRLILWLVFNTEEYGESLFEKILLNHMINNHDVNYLINEIIPEQFKYVGDVFKKEYDSDENFRTNINKMGFTNDFWGESYKKSLHMIKNKTDNYIDFKKIYIPAIMSLGAVAAYELYRKNKKKY